MPKVSIVLPTYNGEKYIEESVMSCLNQTMTDIELIIIDDCSNDNTPHILENLAKQDSRIRVYRNEENLKLPASLNKGFDLASGEYLTWTSDDNLYLENAIEVMVSKLDTNKDINIVYSNVILIDELGNRVGIKKMLPPENILRRNCINACFMFTKEVFQKLNGYDTSLFLVEDYDFWLRAAEEYKFLYIDQELYMYRVPEGSLSSTKKYKILWMTNRLILDRMSKVKGVSKRHKYKAFFFILIRYLRAGSGMIFTTKK